MTGNQTKTNISRLVVAITRLALTWTLVVITLLPGPKRASVAGSPTQTATTEPAQISDQDPAQNMPLDRLMTPEPPPTAPPDSITVVPTVTDTQPPPPFPTPSPEQIEEAKARRAIEMRWAEYLHEAGLPHIPLTDVVVDGEWAYGKTGPVFSKEPLYILAHKESDSGWESTLPEIGDLYSQWLGDLPTNFSLPGVENTLENIQLPDQFAYDIASLSDSRFRYAPGIDDFDAYRWIQEINPVLNTCKIKLEEKTIYFSEGIHTIAEQTGVNPRVLITFAEIEYDVLSTERLDCLELQEYGDWLLQLATNIMKATLVFEFDQTVDNSFAITSFALGRQNHVLSSAEFAIAEGVARIAKRIDASPNFVDEMFYNTYMTYFGNPTSQAPYLLNALSQLDSVEFLMPFVGMRSYSSGPHGVNTTACANIDIADVSGIDFGGVDDPNDSSDTAVLAIANGTVVGIRNETDVPGRWVAIEHENGLVSMYWHLASIHSQLEKGQYLYSGAYLGERGNSGCSGCNPHIHLELRTGGNNYDRWSGIGNRVSWSGKIIDGWLIYAEINSAGKAENYNGSAIRIDSVSGIEQKQISTNCGSVNAGVEPGFPHNIETNTDYTKFAYADRRTQLQSTNGAYCPTRQSRLEITASPSGICGGSSCTAPGLDFPQNSATFSDHTITFRWQPVSGCIFDGYTFRVCTSANVADLNNCIIDTGEGSTQRTETIGSEWDNRDLFWSVKAANAPYGANWAQPRLFRIQPQQACNPPGNAVVLFWNASYDCGGHDPVWRNTPGWSNVPDWFNDKASSVRVPSGWSARLFAHADRGQPSKCFNGSYDNFESETFDGSSLGLNDQVSSYEVFDSPNCSSAQSGLWHAEYFRHPDLRDRIFDDYLDTSYIFFDWGIGGPRSDWPNNDDWSARFTKRVHFQGGEYHFHVQHDDGARVYLDGQLILDAWWDSSFAGHGTVRDISPGEHEVKLEYYEKKGDARVEFWWRGPGALPRTTRDPDQWWAQYHPNKRGDGTAPLSLNEGQGFIHHEWGVSGPGYDLPSDRFSADLERTVDFDCGQYRFNLFADDGVRFWVDDTLVVDEWHDGVNGYQPDVMELSDEHTLKLKYYENGGSAALRLSWEKVGACDDGPPTGRITSPDNLSATNRNAIVIQAEANDSDTGVDRVEFWARYDGSWHHLGDDTTAPYSFEWGVSAVTDQHIQLAVHVVDKAGNTASYAGGIVHVTLDRTTPTGGISSPVQGSYLTSDNVPIVVSANDSGSGIKDVVFLVSTCGTGQWTSIGTDTNGADGWGMTWDASGVPDCGVGFHVFIHDQAGNTRSTGIGATLDRNPPTSFVNGLSDVQRTESFQVSWSGYDAPSGIVEYQVQVRDGTAGTWATWYTGSAPSATYSGQNGHTYYFRCRAIDAAGNSETYPGGDGDTLTIVQTDTEPPVGSIIINDHADFTSNHAVSLTVSATDNGTVAEMEFAVWNLQTRVWEFSGWHPYATSHSFTLPPGDGWKTVWVQFRDNASNISEWATDSIVVDTIAPASAVFDLPPEQSSERFSLSWRGLDDLYSDWPSDGVNVVYRDALGVARDVFVQGQYAYVAAEDAGLRIVDVSSPSFLYEIGQYNTPGAASGVYVSGTLAYIADGWSGLRLISVADPSAPVEVGSFSTPGYAYKVQVVGDFAYVVDSWADLSGLRVISVTNPTDPTEIGYYNTPGEALDVNVVGDLAYVADRDEGGLRIISVANPANLTEVGYYDTPGFAESVYVSGQVAYVSDWFSLRIISVNDPTNPEEIGYYYPPGIVTKSYISGTLAYLAADEAGLQIISVVDPAWPTRIGYYDTPGKLNNLHPTGQHIALADAEAGLQMVNVTNPDSPSGYGFSVAGYSVDYREEPGGDWIPWELNTLATTAEFSGQDNQQYCFRSHGQDWTNNFEDPQYDWGVDGQGADTCTTVHAPIIDVSGFTVDDDQLGESYGNSDGKVNPGEFVELDLSVENNGSGDAEDVFIQPTTTDGCVDTSGAYFYDGYVYHGSLTSGQTGESLDDFDFMVRSDCTPGHNIIFDLSIGDASGNSWQRTLSVPVTGADTIPPGIWYKEASPKYVLPDESTLLSAFVVEQSDVVWARADIQSTDGTFTTTVTLYDDGAHNDGEAGDRFFANEWTPPIEADFEATILAADDYGNVGAGVPVHLTSQRFVARSDILLVYDDWDYQWASGVLTYYTEALETNGLPYDLWDAIYRGPVLTDTLMSYRDGVVIWAMPQFGNLGYKPEVQRALERYLDGGGRLFISGQDIGFYLTWDGTLTNTLYNDYLHAQFVRDDVNLYALDGYQDDPVFAGSHLSISGGDGANNQWWPSEIAPVVPALPVYTYDTTAIKAVAASVLGDIAYQRSERNQAPDGPPRGSNKLDSASVPLDTTSDSVGAIKVDTGIYRVIYFAFGFEAINGQDGEIRTEVLDKVIHWLLPNRPPRKPSYPYPRPGARISEPTATLPTGVVTAVPGETVSDHGIELWWAANDPDPGDEVSFDVFLGTTPVLTEAMRVSEGLTETFYIPGPLTIGSVYYWQIVAVDDQGAQAVGPVWSFEFGEVQTLSASIEKRVTPQGQVNYGDPLTYTLVISAIPGAQIGLYDPLEGVTFSHFVEQPSGITRSDNAITGTLTITPTDHITVTFVAQVAVPGTAGWIVTVTNRACVYPFGGTLGGCVWSNEVSNSAFRPHYVYLPLMLQSH